MCFYRKFILSLKKKYTLYIQGWKKMIFTLVNQKYREGNTQNFTISVFTFINLEKPSFFFRHHNKFLKIPKYPISKLVPFLPLFSYFYPYLFLFSEKIVNIFFSIMKNENVWQYKNFTLLVNRRLWYNTSIPLNFKD